MKSKPIPEKQQPLKLSPSEKQHVMRLFDFFFPGMGHLIAGRFWCGTICMVLFLSSLCGVVYFALKPLADALHSAETGMALPGVNLPAVSGCTAAALFVWVFVLLEPLFYHKN